MEELFKLLAGSESFVLYLAVGFAVGTAASYLTSIVKKRAAGIKGAWAVLLSAAFCLALSLIYWDLCKAPVGIKDIAYITVVAIAYSERIFTKSAPGPSLPAELMEEWDEGKAAQGNGSDV
jgi:hypothetical protein